MLPYRPEPQPAGARISAAYTLVGDRIRIEIDTGGRPLEQVWIMKPDGTGLAPHAVETPAVVTTPGPTVSGGAAGVTTGRRSAVSSGVGITFPIGGGSPRAEGNTVAWFPSATAGPPPWPLYVKVTGVAPTTFPVGGPVAP